MLIHFNMDDNDYIINTDNIMYMSYHEYEYSTEIELIIHFVTGEVRIEGEQAKRLYYLLLKKSLQA